MKAADSTLEVVLVGHSLGGALADLCGAFLKKRGYTFNVITFGAMRMGDQDYADFMHDKLKTNRVTHHKDVVPHFPFRMFEYYNHGQEYYFDGESLRKCENVVES